MLFSMTRRRRARHAAKTTSSPSRLAPQGASFTPLPAGTMRQRPCVDYSNPRLLAGVATASDGHTVVMRTVVLSAAVKAAPVTGATDDTMTLPVAAAAIPPSLWYGPNAGGDIDWPDAQDDAPSLVAAPVMGPELSELSKRFDAVFGHSALKHRAGPDEAWFRAGEYERSLNAFLAEREASEAARDHRIAAFNSRYKVTSSGPRSSVLALDTGILPAVALPEFSARTVRNGVAA